MRTYEDKNQVILSGLYSEIQSLVEYHQYKVKELEKNISDNEFLESEITELDKVYTKNLKFIYDIINHYQTLQDNEKRHLIALESKKNLKLNFSKRG
tara:strand:- start:626 stop:916 length:291 start_codon:yes stop_codon:yes gene_type:complete